jgi:hypothetical protein
MIQIEVIQVFWDCGMNFENDLLKTLRMQSSTVCGVGLIGNRFVIKFYENLFEVQRRNNRAQ